MKPSKLKKKDFESEEEEDDLDLEDLEAPKDIDPYKALGLAKTATEDEIKRAYRKAALKHHPDKSPEHLKSEAHIKFQEVAFAYAVLSDPIRRKRYDATGSTAESIEEGDFSFAEFYSNQFVDAITADAIEAVSKQYKNSDDEKDDVLAAYKVSEGQWAGIYERVMLSDPLVDEERFRGYIDEGIEKGDVEVYKAYTNESKKSKRKRMKQASGEGREAQEAMEYAKELGIYDKIFNKDKKGKGEDSLMAIIQSRQASRGASFLDKLEAKYAKPVKASKAKGKGSEIVADEEAGHYDEPSEEAFQAAAARLNRRKAKKGKKRDSVDDDEDDEPSEEAFQATAAKLEKPKSKAESLEGRKSKRQKR